MNIETYISNKLQEKRILLMTHIVMGYPDFETSYEVVKTMVESGVDMMELQIPFSEPMADGPVIVKANQASLAGGTRLADCLKFAERVGQDFDIPFLFMSYYNILYHYGVDRFVQKMAQIGVSGAIVPDLPPEESGEFRQAMKNQVCDPIFLFTPKTAGSRMQYINKLGSGFIYCVARKGVTGSKTHFDSDFSAYIDTCRENSSLPLAIGFGIREQSDIDYLKGKMEIAVIGSQTIKAMEEGGVEAVRNFISSLNTG